MATSPKLPPHPAIATAMRLSHARTMLKRVLASLGRMAGLALLTATAFLLGCQSKLIYFPRPYGSHELRAFRHDGGIELGFTTSQGRQVAFYRPPRAESASAPVWLFCAGNGSVALEVTNEIALWDRSAGWLLVDFPGYGSCAGRPSPSTIRENMLGAVDALAAHLGTTRESLRPRLGASGHSLGAAAALIAADELDLRRVVLMSPFTSMLDLARASVGWPLCHLLRHRYNNRAPLAAVVARGADVRLFHGAEDEIIPVAMSRELAAAHPNAVRLVEVPDAHHNDLLLYIGDTLGAHFKELNRPPIP
jgi:pimeloyl-ACP methyl ester carboxylesterase